MKKVLNISLVGLLALSLISCSSGIKATTTPESYLDLDKEYGQFNTKALTVSYLKKKLDKWKTDGNGKKMLRELEYAKFKHIDVLEQVINSEADSYSYYKGLKSFIEVTSKEGNDAAFKSFIISLSPDPSVSTPLEATNVTTTSFTANWNIVTNADGYMLIVDNGTPIDVGNVTSKNITGLVAGSSHSYVVKSLNEGGISESSSPVNVTLIPSAPVASDATNINQTSFRANWASVNGATSYKLFVDNTEIYNGSSISCNVTSLDIGSSHSYYVQAINAGGTSTNSNTINLTLNPAIAGVPVASTATDITQTSFTAHWSSAIGATSYKLFIDDVEAYSGTNLSFNKMGLTVGSSHSYYVQAINISGASANSNSINLTLNPAIPSAPVASVATDVTTTSFTANWATVSGATSYKLFIDDVEAYSGTNLNFSKTGLTAGTAHTYYVQASNISGTGSNSNTVDVSTVSSAPVASDATNISNTAFTANWSSVTGATGYKLFVDGINVYNGASTSCNITSLTASSSHSYYVQATNSGGTSSNSNTINLTLNPDAPTAPVANVATDITTTSFTANWASSANASSYTLYVNGTSVYTGTNTSFNKTGLTAGSSNSYYVTATNVTGTSANSNTVDVNTVSSAPVASSATNISNTSFTANWATVTGATSYKLFVDGINVYTGASTSCNVTGLTASSSHSYYVQAINSGGTSSNSNTVNLTLNPDAPNAPVANVASDITTTSFTANWASSANASTYTLFVDGSSVYTGSATNCNITGLTIGSNHSYYVQASNITGTSSNSNTINVSTVSSAPVASVATDITTTSFTANWGSVTGATSYKLFVDGISVYTGTSTNCNITGLTVGTPHTYYIQAINSGGTSLNSNTISVSTLTSAPVANAATSITTTSFTANWASVTGASSYNLFVNGTSVYSGTNTSFNKTGLTAGTAYTYYVQAINDGGASANSNTVNVNTVATAPVASAATSITDTSFTANWATVSGATSYKLFIDSVEAYSGTATSVSKTGLTAASSHSYYVQAINAGGTSANSNTINVTLNPATPLAPVASAASSVTTTSFTANWASSATASSYTLYVDGTSVYTGSNTSFSKTGLTAGTAHNYYVTATNITGTSTNSNTISISTLTSAPVANAASSITTTSFTANWGTVTGAITYNLFVDGISVYNGSSTSANITSLTAGTAHTYYVQAVNSGGNSASSNTINVTTVASAPVASAATSITDTSFIANWATVSGATSYNLYIDSVLSYSGANLSFSKTALTASSAHSYYVQAVNSGGTSANSSTINVTLNPATPLAPVASAASSITTTSFTANWAASATATSYTLYVNGTSVYTGSNTSFSKTGLTAGTAYTYYVTATNVTGTSPNSSTINVNTVPSASVATAATNVGSTTFTANWGAVTGATSYNLFVDGTSVYTGASTTANVTGVSAGTSHNYYVTAINSGGTSVNSNTINLLTIPAAPVASAATSLTATSFSANWATVTGATSYKLIIDGGTAIDVGTALTYSKTGVSSGVTHTYYVQAVNASGTSANSSTINALTIPPAPVANAASSITDTSFTANWATTTGAATYNLYIDSVLAYTGTALTYTKTGLTASSAHSYYVTATNASGTSASSGTINATLNPSTPAAPVASAASSISTTGFTANWAASTNATSYTLYINGTSAYTGSALNYSKTGLTAGTAYTYYVTATNVTGTSGNSNTVNVNTVPSAPTASAATNVGTTTFTANWGTVTGASTYTLYVDGTNVYSGSSTSANVTGVSAGITHTYYVTATNSGGTSANSGSINVLTIPPAPVANAASSITTSSFSANWATTTGAATYNLYIDGSSAYSGTALTYNKTGLSAGTSHTYYVTATNASGTSSSSGTVNVSTIPSAPVATTATNVASDRLTANWGSVTGATSYNLVVDGTSVNVGNVTSYTKTGLAAGSRTYYVQAVNSGGTSANSNSISTTLVSGLLVYYPFTGNITDVSGNGVGATNYSASLTTDRNSTANSAYSVSSGSYISTGLSTAVNSTFTLSMWIKPTATHEIDALYNGDVSTMFGGTAGQNYLVGATHGGNAGNAGVGISAGTNGITVYEHCDGYMPALLIYQATLTSWTHVALVYKSKQTFLYVNGTLVGTGLVSTKNGFMDLNVGSGAYGNFSGSFDEVRVYNRELTSTEINTIKNQ